MSPTSIRLESDMSPTCVRASVRRFVRPLADRRRQAGGLLVDHLNRCEGIRGGGGLVGSISLDPREAKRQTAGILRARLNIVERNLRDDFRLQMHGVRVAPDLDLEE